MSQYNGDKARFHRERKQNIQRRKRTRALLRGTGLGVSATDQSTKPRGIPATIGPEQNNRYPEKPA
jgi:hypothetical protein